MKVHTSQSKRILDYLKTGAVLTPQDALRLFGCFRLAARIKDLRDQGHDIVDHRRGHGHSQYRLAEPDQLDLFAVNLKGRPE